MVAATGSLRPQRARCPACRALERCGTASNVLRVYSDRGGEVIAALVTHREPRSGRDVRDIHLAPPSLETLFISLTGRQLT